MTILVTGGAGYIGSHTVVELVANGDDVLILDNFINSSAGVVQRVERITGTKLHCIEGDIRDRDLLRRIFAEHDVSAVIHFAGLKAVGESVAQPMKYYDNNVAGSLILVEEMLAANVFNLVFSSSATVYGVPASVPIDESMPVGNTSNPYGTSKLMVEHMLTDIALSEPRLSVVLLRYFNPVGAHASGTIGEHPNGAPNNLLPYVCQVAVGKLAQLSVFGDDYDTHDGTGVRDYIHVVDLAVGHIKAMACHLNQAGVHIYNLGTGNGYSVLDVVREFKKVTGVDVPYKIVARRSGDVAACYADASKAKNIGWAATRNLTQMIEDAWRWQSQNPNGYDVI